MKSITRSRLTEPCDSAAMFYAEAEKLLDQVEKRPVRLIGAGIYNLSAEEERQMRFEDLLASPESGFEAEKRRLLDALGARYHLDFAGHLQEIFANDTLHRTVEYMRRHSDS